MQSSPYLRGLCLVALLSPFALAARQGTVAKVAIISKEPFQLQIQTNATGTPQAQIVTSPERLVVDIPNALPGPELRGIPIRSGEVRGVRVSLFSTEPPITRIVVDLNQPQWYRVTPNSSGLLVSLGASETPVDTQSTIGWVTTRGPVDVRPASARIAAHSVEIHKPATITKAPARKGLSIEFSNGLMTIHSGGATLSEILYQIQKVTGAEIAIPSGTEQDKVAADFGPGTPSEVLGDLLNGSGLNFVVVGQESNPNLLRSVILTRKSEVAEAPSLGTAPAQPVADNSEAEYQEAPPPGVIAEQNGQTEQVLPPDQNPPPDQNAQPYPNAQPGQQQNPQAGPPPDPPPTD
jgi:AMIN domain